MATEGNEVGLSIRTDMGRSSRYTSKKKIYIYIFYKKDIISKKRKRAGY